MLELRRQGVAASVRTLTPSYHGYVREEKIAWRETRKGVPVRRLPFSRSNRAREALNREVEDISRRSLRSRDQ